LNGTPECELDSVRYPLAMHHMRYGTEAQRNQLAFHIADNGEQLIERWDDWHLGMGATDHIPGMYYFAAGGDASRYGQIRAPLGYVTPPTAYSSVRHCRYFAAQDANGATYVYRIVFRTGDTSARVQKFSADMTTLYTNTLLAVTDVGYNILGPGPPAFWGGKWYVPVGGINVYRLQTVAVGAAADTWDTMTWRAAALCTFNSGGTSKIARAIGQINVSLATASPLSSADPGDWGANTPVGESTTYFTDMVENQGLLFIAKTDNLFEFDADSISRPIFPFGSRVVQDLDNGKGMLAFGDTILYPSINGLWRYKIGQSVRPVGLDTVGTYTDVQNASNSARMRHRGIVNIGEWLWMVHSDGTTTHPMAARLRRPDDPPGHEFVWHHPATATGVAGASIFVTPSYQLVIQTAFDGTIADTTLALAADGSPAGFAGTRSTGGEFIFGETNFGRPQKRKQIRSVYLDLDGAAQASLGSLTASGVLNYTAGTADKCIRYRPNIQINDAAAILRTLIVEARTPSVYRVVIDGSDEALRPYGLSAEDARTNLMRLVNRGLVSVIGPAGVADMTLAASVPTAWQGYVEALTEIVYQTDSGVGHGFELRVARYTTDGN